MLYIYDILVNFTDGDRIYEFFEWDSRDVVEHIKKIPLIKVSSSTFYDLVYNEVKVSDDLLNLIKNKAFTYNEKIPYAAIFTDGYKCYALEFNRLGEVLFKSSLLLDEEDEIISCSLKLVNLNIDYEILKNKELNNYANTRLEEKRFNIIKKDIEKAYSNKNYAKIDYLYTEVIDNKNLKVDEKYNSLIERINEKNSDILRKLYYIINLSNKKKKIR